jgi:DNA-binding MarR family transcriptional regulator
MGEGDDRIVTSRRHEDQSRCSATALRKASRRLSQLYDGALAPAGLTVTQFGLLAELDRRGAAAPTLTELASAMVMDRSGLGHTLGPLERDGYIAIVADADDRRWRRIVMTAQGRALHKKARVLWEKAQKRFAEVIGAGEVEKLRSRLLAIAHDDRLASLSD